MKIVKISHTSYRDLTDEEVDKFNLRYLDGNRIPFSIENNLSIFYTNNTEDQSMYRLYSRGTNNLLVLKYNWLKDKWEETTVDQIKNVYGLLWLMSIELVYLKEKLNEKIYIK